MPTSPPPWLAASWSRSYIRRVTANGELGAPDCSVVVRYLQTAVDGHSFDLRVASSFALEGCCSMADMSLEQLQSLASGAVECFAGVTTAQFTADCHDRCTVSWHGAFLYPPQLGTGDAPLAVLESISAGTHSTSDIGLATPTMPANRHEPVKHWLEHAPDGSYEEEWILLEGYAKRGAQLAAYRLPRAGERGACWLGINGNTFGFARDIDRTTIPAAALNRPLAETLADDAVPLEAKRRLLDCDFCFGTFGQGGSVGGVVEQASLPWRRGVALANLLGDESDSASIDEWKPVRARDAQMLHAALSAIRDAHTKACSALREAEKRGQVGVAELLRAQGAILSEAAQ